jgi:integrase
MPSLWKRGQSPYWVCCYTSADGQRLKKSTKQRDRAKALEVCLGIERAENLARAGNLTEQTAKKIIGEILERATGEPLHNHKVDEWFEEWVTGKKQSRGDSTAVRYRQVARDFKKVLGKRSTLPLASIAPKDILAYRAAELAAGKSPKTANNAVKVVSAAFNAAFRMGYIPSNPCTALESLATETADREIFTHQQLTMLLKAASGEWRRAILFAYYTGARLGDVANMQWNCVDLAKGIVTFLPKKTKRRKKVVVIPLHADLEAALMKAPGVGSTPLFPLLAGRPTGGKYGLSAQFNTIMEKAGIKGTITRHTPNGRRNRSLSFHSLRHSFNSAMANAGVTQEVRMKLTGHTKADTNAIYTHHDLEPLRAAIGMIPEIKEL